MLKPATTRSRFVPSDPRAVHTRFEVVKQRTMRRIDEARAQAMKDELHQQEVQAAARRERERGQPRHRAGLWRKGAPPRPGVLKLPA